PKIVPQDFKIDQKTSPALEIPRPQPVSDRVKITPPKARKTPQKQVKKKPAPKQVIPEVQKPAKVKQIILICILITICILIFILTYLIFSNPSNLMFMVDKFISLLK
ncbi:hypothetical protein ACFL27_15280, partial [candidate division CSSED10-310 bacterium]